MRISLRLVLRAVLAMCVVTGAARAEDFVYVVRAGDTLIGIGARWLADPGKWAALVRPNGIVNPHYIVPGRPLRMPFALLKSAPEQATVVHVKGSVEADAKRVLKVGDRIGAGAELRSGADGYVTLELADGSRLVLPAQSEMRVLELKRYSNTGVHVSRLRLLAGRIEALVKKRDANAGRFEVDIPTAAIGVRGTDFRAGVGAAGTTLRAEVLDGTVGLKSMVPAATADVAVAAGFGAIADETGRVSAPVALLAAPGVTGLPRLLERPLVRFRLEAMTGASAYRAQIVRDAQQNEVLNEQVISNPELRVAGLADGDYVLRLRAIDARSLEGREAEHAFRLKARPEPPFTSLPPHPGKLRATGVAFGWATAVEAANYHFQLARDERFARIVDEVRVTADTTFNLASLAPGEYYWRVASIRADGDHGPFGDAQRFALFPPPPNPAPPREDGGQLIFNWGAEPGQTFEFQVARDAQFAGVVADLKLGEPRVSVPRPGPGRYYMRVRAIDADGFVGPYTAVQSFELPNCLTSAATGQCVGAGSAGQSWLVQ